MGDNGGCSAKAIKPPTSVGQQVDLLAQRGLIIRNVARAERFLEEVNYYRFTAYLLPFKDGESYSPGTSFEVICRLYEFDRRLRALILSIFEPLEVLLRTVIAYQHAHAHGPDGYYSAVNFARPEFHTKFLEEFSRTIRANDEHPVIRHHLDNYGGVLPLWAAVEFFSFGMLSRFYANLKRPNRKRVAEAFHCGPDYLVSWLRCLTDLRNCCAHYARLYFVRFPSSPRLPDGPYQTLSGRLFDHLYVMKHLYAARQAEIWSAEFLRPLEALVEEYEANVDLALIGFPANWSDLLNL